MEKYLLEAERVIKSISSVDKPDKWKAKNYVGAGKSRLEFLDIKIPEVRKAFNQGFSFYRPKTRNIRKKTEQSETVTHSQVLKIFDYIWKNSRYFEVMLLALYFAATLSAKEKVKNKKLLFSWLKKIDNWAHSDELSNQFAQMLDEDKSLFRFYKKWNNSSNPWERRQSIVGILYYSRSRKKPLSWGFINPMIENLLRDEDYYVQKGVGWCLRESYNLYPEKVFPYLIRKAKKIHPAAWTASTEKLSKGDKATLLRYRKN